MKHFLRLFLTMLLTVVWSMGGYAQTWEKVELKDLTSSDVFVIVSVKGTSIKAMSNDKSTSAAPTAVNVTLNSDKSQITSTVADNIKWNVSCDATTSSYTFYPNGVTDKWLYCTASNNGVRVGTNDNKAFTEYAETSTNYSGLKNTGTSRYIGVYTSDWRCYTSVNSNIKGQDIYYYKYVSGGTSTNVTFGTDFDGKTFDVNEDQESSFTAPTATEKDNVAGTIAYSSDKPNIVSVDATTGALTYGKEFGVATITATFTPTDVSTYQTSTASYKINYIEKQRTATELTFPKSAVTVYNLEPESFTGQTATLKAGDTELTGKTITYSTSSADIFTSFNETDGTFVLNGNAGIATITANFAKDDLYAATSAEYTVTVKEAIKDIATLKELVTATTSGTAQTFNLKLKDAIVTYTSGNNAYIQDATGGLYSSAKNFDLENNDKVNGYVTVKIYKNRGQNQVNYWVLDENATVEKNAEFTPAAVTIADLNSNTDKYENMQVKVVGATVNAAMSNNQTKITQDGSTITLYSKSSSIAWDLKADDYVDVVGFPCTYNSTKEICVWRKGDVTVNSSVVATTLSFDTDETSFTVKKTKEADFVSPKATVKDADNNVVEGAAVKYVSSTPAVATVAEDGTVTLIAYGTTTITASYAGDATHKAAKSVSYTINYVKMPTEMAFSAADVTVNLGEQDKFVAPTLTLTADGESILDSKTVTYESSNENVAAFVDGNIVFGNIEGTATITASYAGDDTYDECSASYTLNVVDPNKLEVTFDFVNNKYGYVTTDPVPEGGTIKSGNITITNVKNGSLNNTAFFDDNLRIYNGSQTSFETAYGYVITKINATFGKKGNFTASNAVWSNGTVTSDGASWTGNTREVTLYANGTIMIANLTVTYAKCPEVTFDENATDEEFMNLVIDGNEEEVSATLNRTMVADGGWYTFSAPFSVADISESPLAGAVLRKYSSMTGSTMNFEATTEIKAGHAYLIKPTEDIKNPVFNNVVLDLGDTSVDGQDGYSFVATLGVHKMETDGTELFLGAENKFYAPTETDKTLKALRGYFVVPEGTSASKMSINIDGETTSISGLHINGNMTGKVYNLNGQYVGNDVKQLGKGIYVVNGKKYIVK